MKILVDRKEIFDLLDEDYGYWECVRTLINKHDLDDHEEAVLRVADDIRETIEDIVESMPVVEEKENATLQIREHHEHWGNYSRKYYLYRCSSCFEIVRQDCPDENFKFCPHCGAKYERIVKYD